MKVYYDNEPEKILYQPLPDGTANVYLRKNICQTERSQFNEDKEEKTLIWTADEKNFITKLSRDDIEQQFDLLFLTADIPKPTLEERISALEKGLMEVTNG